MECQGESSRENNLPSERNDRRIRAIEGKTHNTGLVLHFSIDNNAQGSIFVLDGIGFHSWMEAEEEIKEVRVALGLTNYDREGYNGGKQRGCRRYPTRCSEVGHDLPFGCTGRIAW